MQAPPAPGFYLIDDAQGRFVVDRDFGYVSLADDDLLERECGAVHTARMRVVEPDGVIYEIALVLRITGRIPQLVGGEDNDLLIAFANATEPLTPPHAAYTL